MILFGTDEAGYGPRFGPLVISSTTWETPSDDFSEVVADWADRGIQIGDSKKLYHAGGTIETLEANVLAALHAVGCRPRNVTELFVQAADSLVSDPFFKKPDDPVPRVAEMKKVSRLASEFIKVSSDRDFYLRSMQSRVIFPKEFNRRLERCSSKGALLSEWTLNLVADQLPRFVDKSVSRILVLCDKHGGRNRYLDLLHARFPDDMIRIVRETRESSIYRWKRDKVSIEFRFLAKGETYSPIALASMLSKYLRELSMFRFNAFWQARIPELRPTAGYPEDAARFKMEIIDLQKQLGIQDAEIWRNK